MITGGQIDVGRISNNEHHTPCICTNKTSYEIGYRIDVCIFAKITNKRNKSKNDNIIGSKDCQNRCEKIKDKK